MLACDKNNRIAELSVETSTEPEQPAVCMADPSHESADQPSAS